jgi:hypothetical protein
MTRFDLVPDQKSGSRPEKGVGPGGPPANPRATKASPRDRRAFAFHGPMNVITTMTQDSQDPIEALFDYLKNHPDAADLRPDARANVAHRIVTNIGAHGTPELWASYIANLRKKETILFSAGPRSPEADAEQYRKMPAARKLDEWHKRNGGGNK